MNIQSKLLAVLVFGFWVLFCQAPTNAVTAAAFIAVVLVFGFVQWLERQRVDHLRAVAEAADKRIDELRLEVNGLREKMTAIQIRGMGR